MTADCCSRRRPVVAVGLAYTPAAVLALLLPECPLRLAPLLAVTGVSAVPGYGYWVT